VDVLCLCMRWAHWACALAVQCPTWHLCAAQIAEQKQQNYALAEQLEAAQSASGSSAALQAELEQLQQQVTTQFICFELQ
jgi:hypothetical protein